MLPSYVNIERTGENWRVEERDLSEKEQRALFHLSYNLAPQRDEHSSWEALDQSASATNSSD